MKRFRITCLDCGNSRLIAILKGAAGNDVIDWLDNNPNPTVAKIVSGRKRFDDQWGWECICGTNDLWTEQEKKAVSNLQSPEPKEIADVVNNLKVSKPKFEMVGV